VQLDLRIFNVRGKSYKRRKIVLKYLKVQRFANERSTWTAVCRQSRCLYSMSSARASNTLESSHIKYDFRNEHVV